MPHDIAAACGLAIRRTKTKALAFDFAQGDKSKEKVLYCGCFAGTCVSNERAVVKKYSLEFEEEVPAYMSELEPDGDQLQACFDLSQK